MFRFSRRSSRARDRAGRHLLLAEHGENSISRYDAGGNATNFTSTNLPGALGIALDRAGNVYVGTNANQIEKFSPAGADPRSFTSTGVDFPMALAFDQAGNLFVANFSGSTVQKFTPIAVQMPPTLVNISIRLNIGTGENVLDSGFVVRGPAPKTILIRGLRQSLGTAGVADSLPDPVLELHDRRGAIIRSNDNWKARQEAVIAATGIPPKRR
ncbi:MAG: hypothetical protein ABI233_03155 [Chthoniobacterales bacterium]